MRRRFGGGPPPVSRRTADALSEAQDRITIGIMLDQGGVVTPIGSKAHIRIPSGGFRTFPLALVDDVQARRAARLTASAEATA